MASRRYLGLIGLVFLSACASSPGPESTSPEIRSFTISVDDVVRTYLLRVPASYDPAKKWPVVVVFHGGGGTARGVIWETAWDKKADEAGFLAVFPEGTPPDASRPGRFRDNPQTWNDGSGRANIGAVTRGARDVEFVAAMLADLKDRFSVDERRVYVTGFSNGASMAFRVARELSPIIAAAAPFAGADWLHDVRPKRSVPLLYLTGTADPLNPFAGGEVRIGRRAFGTKPPVREMIGQWVKMHGCSGKTRVQYPMDDATGIAYGRPGRPAAVVLGMIDGHGHHWPGGRSALPDFIGGPNTAKLNATDLIWRFFEEHPLADYGC